MPLTSQTPISVNAATAASTDSNWLRWTLTLCPANTDSVTETACRSEFPPLRTASVSLTLLRPGRQPLKVTSTPAESERARDSPRIGARRSREAMDFKCVNAVLRNDLVG